MLNYATDFIRYKHQVTLKTAGLVIHSGISSFSLYDYMVEWTVTVQIHCQQHRYHTAVIIDFSLYFIKCTPYQKNISNKGHRP
jgi:hypothetical protein